MKKRIAALLLVLCMVLTMLPTAVFAEELAAEPAAQTETVVEQAPVEAAEPATEAAPEQPTEPAATETTEVAEAPATEEVKEEPKTEEVKTEEPVVTEEVKTEPAAEELPEEEPLFDIDPGTHTGHDDGAWIAVDSSNAATYFDNNNKHTDRADGLYLYLTEDITVKNPMCVGYTNDDTYKTEITLCLNGYTITCTAARPFNLYKGSTLNICDHGGNGKIILKSSAAGDTTHAALAHCWQANTTINMYGGTVDASQNTKITTEALICLPLGTQIFNMYGGTLTGNTCSSASSEYCAGAIAAKGKINLYGGTIKNCKMTNTTAGHGGAIYATASTSAVLIDGATIDGCSARQGSAVFMASGTGSFELRSGEIKNCYNLAVDNAYSIIRVQGTSCVLSGGSIHDCYKAASSPTTFTYGVDFSAAKNTLSGTKIYNNFTTGTTGGNGSALVIRAGKTLNFTGGEIYGNGGTADVFIQGTLNVSGEARVKGDRFKKNTAGSELLNINPLTGNGYVECNIEPDECTIEDEENGYVYDNGTSKIYYPFYPMATELTVTAEADATEYVSGQPATINVYAEGAESGAAVKSVSVSEDSMDAAYPQGYDAEGYWDKSVEPIFPVAKTKIGSLSKEFEGEETVLVNASVNFEPYGPFDVTLYEAAEAHTHCFCGEYECGEHGLDLTYIQLTNANAANYFNGSPIAADVNLYLNENVTATGTMVIPSDVTVNVCLNGNSLTTSSTAKLFELAGGTLNVCDCQKSDTAQIKVANNVASATATAANAAILSTKLDSPETSEASFYGITFDGTAGTGSAEMFYTERIATLNFEGCTFQNYTIADNGAAIFVKQQKNGNKTATGAATVNANNCTFTELHSVNGGAIVFQNTCTMNFTRCTFDGCSSTANGGAMYSSNGQLTLKDCTFKNNVSGGNGGALFLQNVASPTVWPAATIDGCTFEGNTAKTNGGAIYAQQATSTNTAQHLTIIDSTITGNAKNTGVGDDVCISQTTEANLERVGTYTISGETKIGDLHVSNDWTCGELTGDAAIYADLKAIENDENNQEITLGEKKFLYAPKGDTSMESFDFEIAPVDEEATYYQGKEATFNLYLTAGEDATADYAIIRSLQADITGEDFTLTDVTTAHGQAGVLPEEGATIVFLSGDEEEPIVLVNGEKLLIGTVTGMVENTSFAVKGTAEVAEGPYSVTTTEEYIYNGVAEGAHIHCECCGSTTTAGDHECADDTEWTGLTADEAKTLLFTGTALNLGEGASTYYFLTEDVTTDKVLQLGSSTIDSGDLHLCLNGHTITYTGDKRPFSVYRGTLVLTDCQEEAGKVITESTCSAGNMFIAQDYNFAKRIDLYNVTLEETAAGDNGMFYARPNTVINVFDNVTITGVAGAKKGGIFNLIDTANPDRFESEETAEAHVCGENVTLTGTAVRGGIAYVEKGGFYFTSETGTLTGTATSGLGNKVYLCAEQDLQGVDDGVYDQKESGLYDGDAEIWYEPWDSEFVTYNTSKLPAAEGNWYLTDDLVLSNQTIQTTGTIRVDLNGHTVTGDGQKYQGEERQYRIMILGGNKKTCDLTYVFCGEGTIYPKANLNGGALAFLYDGTTLVLEKAFGEAPVVDGTYSGTVVRGVVQLNYTSPDEGNGIFIMNDGVIRNFVSSGEAAAVISMKAGTFVMNGGRIENCTTSKAGGAVVYSGSKASTFTLNGGTILATNIPAVGGVAESTVTLGNNGKVLKVDGIDTEKITMQVAEQGLYEDDEITLLNVNDGQQFPGFGAYCDCFKAEGFKFEPDTDDETTMVAKTAVVKVAKPTAVEEELTYNGTEQTGVNYDPDLVDVAYTVDMETSATGAGPHFASFTLIDGYVWDDEDTEPCEIDWEIKKAPMEIVPISGQEKMLGEDYKIEYNYSNELFEGDEFEGKLGIENEQVGDCTITLGDLKIAGGNGVDNYELTITEETINVYAPAATVNEEDFKTTAEAVAKIEELINNLEAIQVAVYEPETQFSFSNTEAFGLEGTLIFPANDEGEDSYTFTITPTDDEEVASWNFGENEIRFEGTVACDVYAKAIYSDGVVTLKLNADLYLTEEPSVDFFTDEVDYEPVSEEEEGIWHVYLKKMEQGVDKPTAIDDLTYTGEEQDGVFCEDFGHAYELKDGTFAETNAGSYQATFVLMDGFYWNGEGDDTKYADATIDWSIAKAPLDAQAMDAEVVFGQEAPESYEISYYGFVNDEDESVIKTGCTATCDYDPANPYQAEYEIEVDTTDFEADNYEVTYAPSGVLTVNKAEVEKPTAIEELVYTGEEQTGVDYDDESEAYTYGGDVTGTNAGEYTATFTLNDGYVWDDKDTEPCEIDWAIAKVKLTATAEDKEVTFGADAPEYTVKYAGFVNGEDEDVFTIGCTATCDYDSLNPYQATYEITVVTSDFEADNYEIGDTFPGTLTVNKAEVEKPTAIEELVYNGKEQTGVNFTPELVDLAYTVEMETYAINAGPHRATFELIDGYVWEGGDTEPIDVDWTIAQKPVTVTADNKEMKSGDEIPELTYQIANGELVEGDELVGTLTVDGDTTVAGICAIVQDADWENPNYDVNFVPGTLTVAAGKLVIDDDVTDLDDPTYADYEEIVIKDNAKVTVKTPLNNLVIEEGGEVIVDENLIIGAKVDGGKLILGENDAAQVKLYDGTVVLYEGSYLTLEEAILGTIEDESVNEKATVKIDGENVTLATLAGVLMEDVGQPGYPDYEAKYIPLTNGVDGEYNLFKLGTPEATSAKAKILEWNAVQAVGGDGIKFRFMPNFGDKTAYEVFEEYAERLSNDDELDEYANFQMCFRIYVDDVLYTFYDEDLNPFTELTYSSRMLKSFGNLNKLEGQRACFYVTLKGLPDTFDTLKVEPFISVDGQEVLTADAITYYGNPS